MRIKTLVLIWICWVVIVLGFQSMVKMRFGPQGPDHVLGWTAEATKPDSNDENKFLSHPFMNNQTAWDSQFYLSIALEGYDGKNVESIDFNDKTYSLSYAFLPLYPMAIRFLSFLPIQLGMDPIAAAVLAGIIISALGTLLGIIAFYFLVKDDFDEEGILRMVFYFLIFPSSFFLLQVYTEGLFIGLSFTCLALIRYKKLWYASLFAALAVLTRAVGISLLIPLIIAIFKDVDWEAYKSKHLSNLKLAVKGLPALMPLLAFLVWKFSYLGTSFNIVEKNFFARGFFNLHTTIYFWRLGIGSMLSGNPQAIVYFLIEIAAILLGLIACRLTIRKDPGMAIFGFLVILISLTSGPAQGMIRYILPIPSVFIFLGLLGKNKVFDRAWVITSILLMGMMATLFTFDKWVA
ncbi:MAG: mannosyltransferase family protein [Bacillota bacterium]